MNAEPAATTVTPAVTLGRLKKEPESKVVHKWTHRGKPWRLVQRADGYLLEVWRSLDRWQKVDEVPGPLAKEIARLAVPTGQVDHAAKGLVAPWSFQAIGHLQEVNRAYFHSRGMALAVTYADPVVKGEDGKVIPSKSGPCTISILDNRDDPEGMVFWFWQELSPDDAADALRKAEQVEQDAVPRWEARRRALGFVIEPLPGASPATTVTPMVSLGRRAGQEPSLLEGAPRMSNPLAVTLPSNLFARITAKVDGTTTGDTFTSDADLFCFQDPSDPHSAYVVGNGAVGATGKVTWSATGEGPMTQEWDFTLAAALAANETPEDTLADLSTLPPAIAAALAAAKTPPPPPAPAAEPAAPGEAAPAAAAPESSAPPSGS